MRAFPGIRRLSAATESSPRCRCCGSIRGWRAACCGGLRSIRRSRSIRWPTPSPGKSCTKCAAARWRRCARCRSRIITAASMRRRCSCCWPASMSSAPATTRRSTELWPAIEAALRLDRRARRSRPRRLRRIPARIRAGPRQSGLEGFLRRDLSCRRPACRGLYRACRSAGLRIRRQAAGGALRLAAWQLPDRARAARGRGASACRAVRTGLLVRGTRHLCARARWRKAAVPGAHLERRAVAVQRHGRAPIAPAWSPPT